MRFGSLHKGFAKCKLVYDSLDEDGNEVIDLQELSIGCQKLGLDITADIISKVFSATDLDGNKVIDFREFIVVLAILYMITTEASVLLALYFRSSLRVPQFSPLSPVISWLHFHSAGW